MFLPYRLLALELKRGTCWKQFLHYQKAVCKLETNRLRIVFLENCKRSELIPRFLKFRVPNKECFDNKSVYEFQRKLLCKELIKAKENLKVVTERLKEKRNTIKEKVPSKLLPSVALYTRCTMIELCKKQTQTHYKKLAMLSKEQEQPLFNVQNTVVTFELENLPPKYVMETLSLGPNNAVLDRFEPKDVLAELDGVLRYCKSNDISDETITDINVKTLTYIKKCKKLKPSRNIQLTQKYLKDNDLVAIPFDKGIGICVMKRQDYHKKLDTILNLKQFEKMETKRKNEKHPVIKEEERIVKILKELKGTNKIDEILYKKLRPSGSQPARLYGLAKVHKEGIPTRPVLSMPGSAYHKICVQIAE